MIVRIISVGFGSHCRTLQGILQLLNALTTLLLFFKGAYYNPAAFLSLSLLLLNFRYGDARTGWTVSMAVSGAMVVAVGYTLVIGGYTREGMAILCYRFCSCSNFSIDFDCLELSSVLLPHFIYLNLSKQGGNGGGGQLLTINRWYLEDY